MPDCEHTNQSTLSDEHHAALVHLVRLHGENEVARMLGCSHYAIMRCLARPARVRTGTLFMVRQLLGEYLAANPLPDAPKSLTDAVA